MNSLVPILTILVLGDVFSLGNAQAMITETLRAGSKYGKCISPGLKPIKVGSTSYGKEGCQSYKCIKSYGSYFIEHSSCSVPRRGTNKNCKMTGGKGNFPDCCHYIEECTLNFGSGGTGTIISNSGGGFIGNQGGGRRPFGGQGGGRRPFGSQGGFQFGNQGAGFHFGSNGGGFHFSSNAGNGGTFGGFDFENPVINMGTGVHWVPIWPNGEPSFPNQPNGFPSFPNFPNIPTGFPSFPNLPTIPTGLPSLPNFSQDIPSHSTGPSEPAEVPPTQTTANPLSFELSSEELKTPEEGSKSEEGEIVKEETVKPEESNEWEILGNSQEGKKSEEGEVVTEETVKPEESDEWKIVGNPQESDEWETLGSPEEDKKSEEAEVVTGADEVSQDSEAVTEETVTPEESPEWEEIGNEPEEGKKSEESEEWEVLGKHS